MRLLPWWVKILLKLALSKLPISYKFWAGRGLFRHGRMDDPDYAISVFNKHLLPFYPDLSIEGKVIVELGPGDSIASAVIANCRGAEVYLVDNGNHASVDKSFYKSLSKRLGNCDISHLLADFDSFSDKYYFTNGIDSLRSFDDASVDFIFSNAVLEHIKKSDFELLICELRRIIKPSGFMSHEVDFRDHLGGGKNNLRFSERLWESRFFSDAGFYTNRIMYSHMLSIFQKSGFSVVDQTRIDHPIKPMRKVLHPSLKTIHDNDLETAIGNFILKPS